MASVHDKIQLVNSSNEKINKFTHWAYDLMQEKFKTIALISADEAYELYKDRDVKKEFRCPKCGNPVYITSDRGKNVFKHYKIKESSLVSSDGPIHKIVKDKIVLSGVLIPSITLGDLKSKEGNNFEVNPRLKDVLIRDERVEILRNCIQECRIDSCNRIGDIFGELNNEKYIIEITHKHGLSEDKIAELKDKGQNVIEVVVTDKDGIIDRLDYKWVINDRIVMDLYKIIWMFCKHSYIKDSISHNKHGKIEHLVPCKRKMDEEEKSMIYSDLPHREVMDRVYKSSCDSNIDCIRCPRYFGVDHDKNKKDIVQCLLVDGDDGSKATIATVENLANELRNRLKRV